MDARHTNGIAAVAQTRASGQGQGVSSTNLAQNENLAFAIVRKQLILKCAPVAQLDRASGYEPEGRVFESPRAHH